MGKIMSELKTKLPNNWVLPLICVLSAVAFTIAAIFLYTYEKPYKPPPFEKNSLSGVPAPPDDNTHYSVIDTGNFYVGFVGIIRRNDDDSLTVYFTNPEENDAYLMCMIADEDGNELYKSGLIRPGEYINDINPIARVEGEFDDAVVEVYAFEPETYYSMGTIVLRNRVVAWNYVIEVEDDD
ncbi:MAG: hypothetical protein FWH07_08530 [Oscillospiraceae bacterium]|nr:hypothetical protein [Oscillospiraceae bacterium]